MKEESGLSPVDVAVIGAGMAGLATAVYARLAGLSVRVFERHFLPGGLCTSWRRSGYVFDYCVEYLLGTGEDQGFHDIWQDLGILEGRQFRHIESFGRYVASDGRTLDLYTDPRRLRAHLLSLSPGDAARIEALCAAIRRTEGFLMSEFALTAKGLSRLLRSLPAAIDMTKWAGISVRAWCAGLQSPFLREAIPPLIGSVDFPMAGPIMAFGLMSSGNAAYPLGGSLPMAKAAEARARSLGAQFEYRAGVERVLVEDGRAVGIALEDGRTQRARHVVAACDARTAFDGLLQGRVRSAPYEERFAEGAVHPGLVQVSLGVRIDPAWGLGDMPSSLDLPLRRPVELDGRERTRMTVRHYAHDPAMAPAGCTALLVRWDGDYDRWKALRADPAAYEAVKARIHAETVRGLEESFPGMGSRIEASDVATPVTCERYTGSWRGSPQGWILTTEWMKRMMGGARLPKAFPEVRGFHLIGQWTEPGGGLPPAARDGRDVVRAIRREDRRRRR